VVRRGKVRRAKLYYLRDLRGKKARIAEATSTHALEATAAAAKAEASAPKAAKAPKAAPKAAAKK
jgi:large subunit ribosomal protein L19